MERSAAATQTTGPAIEVTGLVKRYGPRNVVDGIDLLVQRGECFALLGPNGAGKTTTIEILEGFRSRDAGTVTVLGVDPAGGDRLWRARVGVVAQSQGDGPDLTVREMVTHLAGFYAHPRDPKELIASVGLQSSAATRIARLSGGQRRRLDVAIGLVGRPELVFLDEPTTGMDPAARRQFWTLIEELKAEGTTILLTTHYLDEVEHLADRVAVITCGRLVETAPPARLGRRLQLGATVSWTEDGTSQERTTATPTAVVRDLLAQHPTGEIDDLAVFRPTLEDVYLALIDAALIDDAQGDGTAATVESSTTPAMIGA